jgi:hypothetical protein
MGPDRTSARVGLVTVQIATWECPVLTGAVLLLQVWILWIELHKRRRNGS